RFRGRRLTFNPSRALKNARIYPHRGERMFRIQTLNNISQQGLKHFTADYALTTEPGSPDALLVRSAPVDADNYSTVQCIARAGAGVNNITIDKATARGICVFNTPGA